MIMSFFGVDFDILKPRNSRNKFSYVPPQKLNDVMYTKLQVADIKSEVTYWESAMICYVLEASPPPLLFAVLKGFIRHL